MPNLKSFAFGLYIESTRLSLRRRRHHRRRCARAAGAVGVGGGCVTPPPPPTSASAAAGAAAALPRRRSGCSGRRWLRFHGATLPPGPESGHCPALRLADGCPVAPPPHSIWNPADLTYTVIYRHMTTYARYMTPYPMPCHMGSYTEYIEVYTFPECLY